MSTGRPQRQELEWENQQLKNDLNELRRSIGERAADTDASKQLRDGYDILMSQLKAATEELDARKEEVVILRTQIVSAAQQHDHNKHAQVCGRRGPAGGAVCSSGGVFVLTGERERG